MRKNKDKKKINGYKIVGILLLISSLILFGIVLYINILPMKYLLALGGILLFVNLVLDFFLFRKRVKKKPKRVCTVFALLFSIIFLIGSFFIFKTFGVLDDMSQDYKTYTYHVLVKSDSNAEKIEDIASKNLGYYNDNSSATKKALEKLDTVVRTKSDSYGNLDGLGKALINDETDAILLENSQKIKLENAGGGSALNNSDSSTGDTSVLSNFGDKTKVIYTFKVRVKVDSKGIDVTKDVFNIYISGMDEYGKVSEISRSDVNMILTINPKTKQILMTNVPRDYYVQLHDTTGYKDKLTHAGTYGVDTSIKTLEDLLGIKLDYYFKVNFSSLENIVNALDGVDVYSEYDFQSWNGYNFTKGYNHVEGKAALAFARERHTFTDGDNQRGKNQQALIEAIFRKCTSSSIITKYNSLLDSLQDSMITDMPMKSITSLAKMQLRDNASWNITSNSLTGTGSYDYTYTYNFQELYVMVPNEDSVTEAKEKINKVASGEKLESSYGKDTSDVHSVSKSQVSKASSSSYSYSSSSKKKNTSSSVKKKSNTSKKSSSSSKSSNSNKKSSSTTTNKPVTDNKKNNIDTKPSTGSDDKNPGGGSGSGSHGSGSGDNTGSNAGGNTSGDSGESGNNVESNNVSKE